MDISSMSFDDIGDVGVSQCVKRTLFTDYIGEKHVVYHVEILKKPLCIHMYTKHKNNNVVICTHIEKWSILKSWYLNCLDCFDCCEEDYHPDLLRLFDGLEKEE